MLSLLYTILFFYGIFSNGFSSPVMNIQNLQHQKIVQHCVNVFKEMGIGHSERVYHNALLIELQQAKIPFRSEVICPYFYKGIVTGYGTADVVLYDTVLELKAQAYKPDHGLQVKKYIHSLQLNEKKKYSGMVINFNQKTGDVDHVHFCFNRSKLT